MTCEEPVCQHCVLYGPHNNQLHKIIDIDSAYRGTVSHLSHIISSGLLSKKDLLLAQIHRISYRMDEISYARSVIEKDVRGEFSGVSERLKNQEGAKLAIIQNEMANLQSDIERIDNLVKHYDEFRKTPIQFLIRYRNFREEAETMISKPFKKEITETPYDLPRELAELREKLSAKSSLLLLLKTKDEIIHQMFNSKKEYEKQTIQNFNQMTAAEVKSWAQLTDKYTQDLEQFQMICYYCGEVLSPDSVNTQCPISSKKKIPKGFTGFTDLSPPEEFQQTGRHFFHYPKKGLFKNGQAFNNLQRLFSDQQAEVLKKGLLLQIEKNLANVRKKARERNINVAELFKKYDTQGIGIMSKAKFTYILHELLGVQEPKINSFLELLDPSNQNMVNYSDFLELIHDPKLLKAEKDGNVRAQLPPREDNESQIGTDGGDSLNPSMVNSKQLIDSKVGSKMGSLAGGANSKAPDH